MAAPLDYFSYKTGKFSTPSIFHTYSLGSSFYVDNPACDFFLTTAKNTLEKVESYCYNHYQKRPHTIAHAFLEKSTPSKQSNTCAMITEQSNVPKH